MSPVTTEGSKLLLRTLAVFRLASSTMTPASIASARSSTETSPHRIDVAELIDDRASGSSEEAVI